MKRQRVTVLRTQSKTKATPRLFSDDAPQGLLTSVGIRLMSVGYLLASFGAQLMPVRCSLMGVEFQLVLAGVCLTSVGSTDAG